VRRVHDEGAGDLLPLIVDVEGVPAEHREVEIGAGRASGEAHGPGVPRMQNQAVAPGGGMGDKTVH
jgi:hypothetical protein